MAHLAFFNKIHEAVFPHEKREEKSRGFVVCRHLAALGVPEGGADKPMCAFESPEREAG